jgi:hypothetical protein
VLYPFLYLKTNIGVNINIVEYGRKADVIPYEYEYKSNALSIRIDKKE